MSRYHPTSLMDAARLEQFNLLFQTPRPFHQAELHVDAAGHEWRWRQIGRHAFALPAERHRKGVSFGRMTQRLLFLLHAEVRHRARTMVRWGDGEIKQLIWGAAPPRNWRLILRRCLASVRDLHVGVLSPSGGHPVDVVERLITRINFNRQGCVILVAPEFLGCMGIVNEDQGDVAAPHMQRLDRTKLGDLRREGLIRPVYLPVYLGVSRATGRFSSTQAGLLQAVLMELTRERRAVTRKRKQQESTSSVDTFAGVKPDSVREGLVPDCGGRNSVRCPYLGADQEYVCFAGNGKRRSLGYRLKTWSSRAGYENVERFLGDLHEVASRLELIPAAIERGTGTWYGLPQMRAMAARGGCRQRLERLNMRIYAPADWLQRWNAYFGWHEDILADEDDVMANANQRCIDELLELLHRHGFAKSQVAPLLGVTPQYLGQVLQRQKSCSLSLLERISEYVVRHPASSVVQPKNLPSVAPPSFELIAVDDHETKLGKSAEGYHDLGWNVIPIRSWQPDRHPYVRWAQYQEQRIDRSRITEWWGKWADAGIAVILGSMSGVVAVDVDGEWAHRILVWLLGDIPCTPTSRSGGQDPHRFHLFFRWPEGHSLEIGAKATPWNGPHDSEKLEIRGEKGIIVLPPSKHRSGRRYQWVRDRTPWDVELAPLPQPLLDGLGRQGQSVHPGAGSLDGHVERDAVGVEELDIEVARSTANFLVGRYVDGPAWNSRLFQAACDLHARGMDHAEAEQRLLAGAQPRSQADERAARATIASAFSRPRQPSRS